MMTSSDCPIRFSLQNTQRQSILDTWLFDEQIHRVRVGVHAYVCVITLVPEQPLSDGQRYYYDFSVTNPQHEIQGLAELIPDILYPDQHLPSFVFNQQLSRVLHGSCRKPHHASDDGLLAVDSQLQQALNQTDEQVDMLIMSGDQVYVDDVAGPTLVAIHQVVEILGLYDEDILIEDITDGKQLLTNEQCYYQRPLLLPDDVAHQTVISYFFAGKKKPIFTSVNANNHLVTFAEVMAMYTLIWSPEMWRRLNMMDERIPTQFKDIFHTELPLVKDFAEGMSRVRRALAHVPVYMIFDDHDVTDDWNLTRGWEDAVYNNPFARRIVGNALIGYWLCQGWANDTAKMTPLAQQLCDKFSTQGILEHDRVIDILLDWDQWHFALDTQPKVVVLDTRTQRWRSESSLVKPSGLMDWEALCELQQELIGQDAVIMVSAAPIFGVKLIETVQRIFTFFGKSLMVDAENWMAHKGTASVILNIFRHFRTPPNFVILSGDVHYSFVYDITLKFRRNSPQITQITCSGIKNEFPKKLLTWFDRLNRILFHPKSPLNWLTQRRNMKIKHRKPNNDKVRTLHNGSGIGLLELHDGCKQVDASVISAKGEETKFAR
ncbi:alkaline phosphatase family protein [Aliiglaciecola sp. LCG003]|uniref:alkaline phosphatase family protein n=1 Tax=Aliiglaciecola sp. LCG003 TaxID=3053655 RepID=UPI0025747A48|nr:alkaline phosphatase family protein [Aliiglaciecola sp. LCG003]WJG09883.1 alkaline phosphatase family protein [Aliiglaciecola sp. LCG003]